MSVKTDLKYAKSHEWVQVLENGNVRVGITDHAQEAMGDLVFVELPEVEDSFEKGASFAVVESVKAVSDVYVPVGGTVVAINEELLDTPELVNQDAYGAWMVELSGVEMADDLMDAAAYEAHLEEEG